MQMENELEKRIRGIIREVFEISEDETNEEYSMDNVDLWDSMGHMKLLVALEQDFGIKFDIDELIEMVNYSKIKEIIEGKTKST